MKNLKTYKNNSMTIFTSSTRALRRCTPSLSVIPSISAISSIRYCSSHASDPKPADTLGDNTKLFRITLPEDDASPEAVDAVVLQIDHLILAACKLRVCPPEMLKIAPTIICGRAVGKTIDLAPLKLSEFVSQAPSDIKARLGKISKFVLDVILDAWDIFDQYYAVDIHSRDIFLKFIKKPSTDAPLSETKAGSDFGFIDTATRHKLQKEASAGTGKTNLENKLFPVDPKYFKNYKSEEYRFKHYCYRHLNKIGAQMSIKNVFRIIKPAHIERKSPFVCIFNSSGTRVGYFRDFFLIGHRTLRMYWRFSSRKKNPSREVGRYSNPDFTIWNKHGDVVYGETGVTTVNYIKPLDKNKYDGQNATHIIAADLETFSEKGTGRCIPYAVGVSEFVDVDSDSDEMTQKIFWAADYEGACIDAKSKNMIFDFLQYIMHPTRYKKIVYFHNLAGFDGPILFEQLMNFEGIKFVPLIHNGTWYSVKITGKRSILKNWYPYAKYKSTSKTISVTLKDSLHILPASLAKLCKSFSTETSKGTFPHDFASEKNLDYVGTHPETQEEGWCFRTDSFRYLTSDVKSLLEILKKYHDTTFETSGLNVFSVLTISALALQIFRKDYLKPNTIPISQGLVDEFVRSGYYGGTVDVYKPTCVDAYYYDINSLYPYAMTQDMPVGRPVFVNMPDLDNFFGFAYVTVVAPENIEIPVLPKKTVKGLVHGTGTWSGVYFSEELKYAVKLGYTITPHHGYRFNRSNKPFKEFVQTFYDKKRDAKDGAIRQLAKLTLNSTYGTFGSKIANETTSIVRNDEELEEIYNNYLVTHEAVIGDGFIAVTHGSNPSPEVCVDLEDYIGLVYRADRRVRDNNTSVSISAAVTAISRVIIHKYKTIPGNPCIYSDTDSVILQYPLSDDQIGTELGQMKLEYKIKEGYFVAPKIYYIETDQGEVIKKFKGVASAQVTKEDYLKLYQGSSVTVSGNLRFRKRNKVAGLNKLLCAKTIKPYDGGKRSIVRDSEGCWVDTKAVNLNVLEGTIDPTALVKSAAPDPKTSKLLAPLGKT